MRSAHTQVEGVTRERKYPEDFAQLSERVDAPPPAQFDVSVDDGAAAPAAASPMKSQFFLPTAVGCSGVVAF
jgi:hypothetical protein